MTDAKSVEVMCPNCGTVETVRIRDKATSTCCRCHWPVDVHPDGTLAASPLADCRGRVAHESTGMMCGHPTRTKHS